jgi:hypothetical protein
LARATAAAAKMLYLGKWVGCQCVILLKTKLPKFKISTKLLMLNSSDPTAYEVG